MSLEQLVLEIQTGNTGEAAFAEICQRFTGLVKKYANQPHVAVIKEEALAEGWLAVAAAVRTYDPAAGVRFAGYVESKVKYAVWNLFKRERRHWQQELLLDNGCTNDTESEPLHLIEMLVADEQVESEVETQFINQIINDALLKLPEKQRLTIVKTLLGEAQLADIAAELNVTPQAVYGLRQRGLVRLRKELANNLL